MEDPIRCLVIFSHVHPCSLICRGGGGGFEKKFVRRSTVGSISSHDHRPASSLDRRSCASVRRPWGQLDITDCAAYIAVASFNTTPYYNPFQSYRSRHSLTFVLQKNLY